MGVFFLISFKNTDFCEPSTQYSFDCWEMCQKTRKEPRKILKRRKAQEKAKKNPKKLENMTRCYLNPHKQKALYNRANIRCEISTDVKNGEKNPEKIQEKSRNRRKGYGGRMRKGYRERKIQEKTKKNTRRLEKCLENI